MTTSKPPATDRRSGHDRRQEDAAPPGKDRRRGIEPRKPDVSEVTLTDSEWGRLESAVPAPSPARKK